MTQQGKTIGIIGGTGRMGLWFADFFSRAGHEVLISGRKTSLSTADIASKCDVVVLSLLHQVALEKAMEVGPMLSEGQLLMDLCSLKEKIMFVMAGSTQASVIGVHPLFGPGVKSIQGQNVILCPERGGAWTPWLKEMLAGAGAVVTECDPSAHDRHMALVQGVNHFLAITLGRMLMESDTRAQDLLPLTTPVFRIQLDLVGRLFAQNLDMFRDLVSENPHVLETLKTFFSTAQKTAGALFMEGSDASLNLMEQISGFLGDFKAKALTESEACISRIYEQEPA